MVYGNIIVVYFIPYFIRCETSCLRHSKCHRSKWESFLLAHTVGVRSKQGATSWCPAPHGGWKWGLRINGSIHLTTRGAPFALNPCSVQSLDWVDEAVWSRIFPSAAAGMNTWGKQCPSGGGISSILRKSASISVDAGSICTGACPHARVYVNMSTLLNCLLVAGWSGAKIGSCENNRSLGKFCLLPYK